MIKLKSILETLKIKTPNLNESYFDNIKAYEAEFKKRGMKRNNESYSEGGYEDIWYKDLDLGRFAVMISGLNLAANNPKTQSKYPEYDYSVFFEPWPKYKTKLFGLIKTKDRMLGKLIQYGEGRIDFSDGLFKVDDATFMTKLFKLVDDGLAQAEKIADVEYLSYDDSKIWGRPAMDNVK